MTKFKPGDRVYIPNPEKVLKQDLPFKECVKRVVATPLGSVKFLKYNDYDSGICYVDKHSADYAVFTEWLALVPESLLKISNQSDRSEAFKILDI